MAVNKSVDISKLLDEYQTGVVSDETAQPIHSVNPAPSQEYEEPPVRNRIPAIFSRSNEPVSHHFVGEAARAGYGQSVYDERNPYESGIDLDEMRALEQSGFAKVGSGLMKGGVTALATGINTVLGTLAGAATGIWSMGKQMLETANPESSGITLGDIAHSALDDAVNNWVSERTVNMQKWAEEQFPNYRTQWERTEDYQQEWWKHMGSANFIGDSLLKNFGFTVGAMGGGVAVSKLLSWKLGKQLVNNVMQGAVAAAEGDAKATAALGELAEQLKRGTASSVDVQKLLSNSKEAAKMIRSAEAKLQLYGSVIGAMGEGTIEGLMAKREFLEDIEPKLEKEHRRKYAKIEEDVLNEPYEKGFYNIITVNGQDIKSLTPDGMLEVKLRQNKENKLFESKKVAAAEQAERLASTTFLLNLPILTTSNLIQFGRMFSGGWQTSRGKVSGIKSNIQNLSKAFDESGKYVAPELKADFTSTLTRQDKILRGLQKSLKNAGSEAFEEMAQGTVSSGAKNVADSRIASFNNEGYDPDAINSTLSWFANMYQGGAEYLGDFKNWQEGALGALTGLFGIPGKFWKGQWNGGAIGAFQEASQEIDESNEMAGKLHTLVNRKDFQDRWHNYIRHLKYDNDMADALERNDEFAWHNANHNQLINDIMTFSDAGRLDDLLQIVTQYGNITEQDAEGLRELMQGSDDESDTWKDLQNKSAAEIVERVKVRANEMKDAILEYKDIYEALSTRAKAGTSPELLKELTFTAAQIKDFDNRYLKLFSEVMQRARPALTVLGKMQLMSEGENEENAIRKAEEAIDGYERMLAASPLPIPMSRAERSKFEDARVALNEQIGQLDEDLKNKLDDLKKLSDARQEFYRKYVTLTSDDAQQKFDDAAITQGKVEDAATEEFAEIETEGLDTFDMVRRAYQDKTDLREKNDFIHSLERTAPSNPAIKEFIDFNRFDDGFRAHMASNPIPNRMLNRTIISNTLDSIFRRASSKNEYADLPDSVFPLYETEFLPAFRQNNIAFLGSIDNTAAKDALERKAYDDLKAGIRAAMGEYTRVSTANSARQAVSAVPASPAPEEPIPQAYDAPQPGSTLPGPSVAVKHKDTTKAVQEVSSLQPAEKENETPISDTPEKSGFSKDVAEFQPADFQPKEEQVQEKEGTKGKTAFYQMSINEVDTGEEKAAREGLMSGTEEGRSAYENADLSDFVHKKSDGTYTHPEYKQTWDALVAANAFVTVATELKEKDEVEFAIDPNFPTYKGKPQILVRLKRNHKVLTILHGESKEDKYYGLHDLRKTILEEYNKSKEKTDNKEFVFNKTSRVWRMRPGLMQYDFSSSSVPGKSFESEKGIKQIPGYSSSSPIVYVGRDGHARVVRGSDMAAMDKVSFGFNNPESNLRNQRVGNLYYLVPSKNGQYEYIPVRLFVEHFRKDNKNASSPVFDKIHSVFSEISDIAQGTTNDNIEEQNKALHKQLDELVKYLDIHNTYFTLGNFGGDVGLALKVVDNWNSTQADPNETEEQKQARIAKRDENTKFIKISDITEEYLSNIVAGLNKSLQIRLDAAGSIGNISQLIDNNLITSNAVQLRPKGVNFYMFPWDEQARDFIPVTSEQVSSTGESAPEEYADSAQQTIANEPVPQTVTNDSLDDLEDDFDFETVDDNDPLPNNSSVEQGTLTDSDVDKALASIVERIDSYTRSLLKSAIATIHSNGVPAVSSSIEALVSFGRDSFDTRTELNALVALYNSIMADKDLQSVGVPEYYSAWDLRHDVQEYMQKGQEGEFRAPLGNVFAMISAMLTNYDTALRAFAYANGIKQPIVVQKFEKRMSQADVSSFSNLPADLREALSKKGIDENNYPSSIEEQDKLINCAYIH